MKKGLHRWYLLILSVMLLVGLAACGGNDNADTNNNGQNASETDQQDTSKNEGSSQKDAKVIRISHNMPVDSGPDASAKKFKELVEERTDGAIKVEIYGQSQLGSMREQTESVQFGSIEMTIQPISTLTPFVEDIQVVDFPFLWPNTEVLWEVLDGGAGEKILATMDEAGFKGLGFWASGFKAITANKPITSPEDFEGFKMRVMPSPLLIAQYEAWGANPVPIDFAELYNALQQKVVDGQENPLETIYLQKYYEVQKNVTIANHGYLAYISTMNKDFFDSLSSEHQEIIVQAEKEAREVGRKIAEEMEQKYIDLLKEEGMDVYVLSDEEKQKFREASLNVHEQFSKTDRQKDILKAVYEAVEAAQ